jgi:hypothetical protein
MKAPPVGWQGQVGCSRSAFLAVVEPRREPFGDAALEPRRLDKDRDWLTRPEGAVALNSDFEGPAIRFKLGQADGVELRKAHTEVAACGLDGSLCQSASYVTKTRTGVPLSLRIHTPTAFRFSSTEYRISAAVNGIAHSSQLARLPLASRSLYDTLGNCKGAR